jgi:TetR/AcrR family transcriptional repressor of nem operon
MARPKEFDEAVALDAALLHFWIHGYEATSVRDLADSMGITGASLYNTFGDKRTLYRRALDFYVEQSYADPVRRFEQLAPRDAIAGFLNEVVDGSLNDSQHKGCLLVNSALEVAPHDTEFRTVISKVLTDVETFFCRCVSLGQAERTISNSVPADDLARLLLGVFLGLRVLARTRPERALLEGLVRPALAMLEKQPLN